jgi:hypothetical protein
MYYSHSVVLPKLTQVFIKPTLEGTPLSTWAGARLAYLSEVSLMI